MLIQMQDRDEGLEEEDSKKKWICEYCTYSNWQSSMKCTMCRGKKPAMLCSTENIYSAAKTNTLRGEEIAGSTICWEFRVILSQ